MLFFVFSGPNPGWGILLFFSYFFFFSYFRFLYRISGLRALCEPDGIAKLHLILTSFFLLRLINLTLTLASSGISNNAFGNHGLQTQGCEGFIRHRPPGPRTPIIEIFPPHKISNGPNTVSESTVSNTELSEFFGPHRVPGRELSEFLSAYYLRAKANPPSFFRRTHRVCRKTQ